MDKLIKYAQNIISICIDDIKNGSVTGKCYHCFSAEPIYFNELGSLLMKIETLYDTLNLPQAATKTRVFSSKNKEADSREEIVTHMTPKEVNEQKGSKATFVVHVQYRQNATWQGNVVWAEKNISKNFRSALELLKLIDGALDDSETEYE